MAERESLFRCRAYWTPAQWVMVLFGRRRLVCSACGADQDKHAPVADV